MARRLRVALLASVFLLSTVHAGAEERPSDETKTAALPAEEPGRADATALLEEGKQLFERGEYEAACRKFAASVEKKAGAGNRFQLANCYEKLGRTASAHALFLAVADATRTLEQPEREKLARDRAAALEPRLARVTLNVSDAPEGFTLELDDKPVADADRGRALPVDPGEHRARASAPGRVPWSTSITIASEPGTTHVAVPALPEQPGAPAAAVTAPVEGSPAPEAERRSSPVRRTATLALAGVGGIAIVTGIAMTGIAVASGNDADDACANGPSCSSGELAQQEELENGAQRAKTWAIVGFGTGAAALGCAAYLYFSDPARQRESTHGVSARPFVSAAPGGLGGGIQGRF